MELIIFIILAYGITNIIVTGSIFDGVKSLVWKYTEKLSRKNTVLDEDILDAKKYGIEQSVLDEYYNAIESFQMDTSSVSLSHSLESVKKYILDTIRNKKVKLWRKVVVWGLMKLRGLLECHTCTGFWVGIILGTVSFFATVKLLGVNMVIANSAIGIFYAGCISSITSFAISLVLNAIYVVKPKA